MAELDAECFQKNGAYKVDRDGQEILVTLAGSRLAILNKHQSPVYVGVYFSKWPGKRKVLYRLHPHPILIQPEEEMSVQRPSHKSRSTGQSTVLVSSNDGILEEVVSREKMDRISSHGVTIGLRRLVVVEKDGLLELHSGLSYSSQPQVQAISLAVSGKLSSISGSLVSKETQSIKALSISGNKQGTPLRSPLLDDETSDMDSSPPVQMTDQNRDEEEENPSRNSSSNSLSKRLSLQFDDAASFSLNLPLHPEEARILEIRREKARVAIERLLGLPEDSLVGKRVPNISLCLSGGGYRALIASLGAIYEYEQTSILDCFTHIASLSGSCWALGMLYAAGRNAGTELRKCATKLTQSVMSCIKEDAARAFLRFVRKQRKLNKLPNRSRGIELYEAMLSSQMFSDLLPDGFRFPFSNLAKSGLVGNGSYPIPIFTSVFEEPHGYEWMEFTPWEVGSEYIGCFAPVDTLGSVYRQGVLREELPELRLGTVMAVTTSAFCLTMRRLIHEIFLTFDCPEDNSNSDSTLSEESLESSSACELTDFSNFVSLPSGTHSSASTFSSDLPESFHSRRLSDFPAAEWPSQINTHTDSFKEDATCPLSTHRALNARPSNYVLLERERSVDIRFSAMPPPIPDQTSDMGSDLSSSSTVSLEGPEWEEEAPKTFDGFKGRIERTLQNNDWIGNSYLFNPAAFPNFALGVSGSPVKRRETLELFDGGNDFCIPLPPLLRESRKSDIIVMIEMSSPPDIDCAKALRRALKWANSRGHGLPPVQLSEAQLYKSDSKIICLWEDPNPNIPTLIYITLQHNPGYDPHFDPVENARMGGYCNTGNSRFSPEQIEELAGLMAYNVKESIPTFIDAIRNSLTKLNPEK